MYANKYMHAHVHVALYVIAIIYYILIVNFIPMDMYVFVLQDAPIVQRNA